MEPVTHLGRVDRARFTLVCALCRKTEGACIQCDFGACARAYHVTCAQYHGLQMEVVEVDAAAQTGKHHHKSKQTDHDTPLVKLRSFCQSHSQVCGALWLLSLLVSHIRVFGSLLYLDSGGVLYPR